MNYPNGNTVADVKKSVSSTASRVGSNIKSEAKDLKSDLKSEAKDLKSDFESADSASDVKSVAKSAVTKASSSAGTILSSALSFLPIKNTDEAISMLQDTVKDVQGGLETARASATSFVKKYPLYSLLGAAAIGAVAVMVITRKSSAADDIQSLKH